MSLQLEVGQQLSLERNIDNKRRTRGKVDIDFFIVVNIKALFNLLKKTYTSANVTQKVICTITLLIRFYNTK